MKLAAIILVDRESVDMHYLRQAVFIKLMKIMLKYRRTQFPEKFSVFK